MMPREDEVRLHAVVQPAGDASVAHVACRERAFAGEGEGGDAQVEREVRIFLVGEEFVERLLRAPVQCGSCQRIAFGMFRRMHEAGCEVEGFGADEFDVDAHGLGRMPAEGHISTCVGDAYVIEPVGQEGCAAGKIVHCVFFSPARVHEDAHGQTFEDASLVSMECAYFLHVQAFGRKEPEQFSGSFRAFPYGPSAFGRGDVCHVERHGSAFLRFSLFRRGDNEFYFQATPVVHFQDFKGEIPVSQFLMPAWEFSF